MEKELLKKTGVISLIVLFMASLGVNVANVGKDQGYLPYSCDVGDDMLCYKLSRVGTTGVNRNCYYDRDNPSKYKTCSSGWELMTGEINIECPSCPKVNVVSYVTNCESGQVDKYFCDGFGADAQCIKDSDLTMPWGG